MPFDAITGFTDPSVPFGFKLEPRVTPRGGAGARPVAHRARCGETSAEIRADQAS